MPGGRVLSDVLNLGQSRTLVNALGSISGATSVDLLLGDVITATITGATAFTFTNVPPTGKCCCITMILVNPGTNVSFATVPKWPAGAPPTLSVTGTDIITLMTVDGGTTWYAVASSIGAA